MRLEARVTRVVDARTFVSVTGKSGCGRCEEPGGCRSDMLGEVFGSRCREYEVDNLAGARAGAVVAVDVPDGVPLRVALLVYGMPLAAMLGTAVLAVAFGAGEPAVIVSSLLALVCSILFLRAPRIVKWSRRVRPQLVDVLEP